MQRRRFHQDQPFVGEAAADPMEVDRGPEGEGLQQPVAFHPQPRIAPVGLRFPVLEKLREVLQKDGLFQPDGLSQGRRKYQRALGDERRVGHTRPF